MRVGRWREYVRGVKKAKDNGGCAALRVVLRSVEEWHVCTLYKYAML